MREMGLVLAADLLKKCTCGLEHGQPAQRTMSKVILDGILGVFDASWSQSSQNGVIVLMMFLYEARARLVQEHHQHNWDILGQLNYKEQGLQNLKKNIPGNKNITFSCTSLNQEY